MNNFYFKLLVTLGVALSLCSCSGIFQPLSSGKATTGYHSAISDLLRAMPPPTKRRKN